MTEQPQQVFHLITEDEIAQIIGMVQDDDVNWSKRIIKILDEDVSSRPAPSPTSIKEQLSREWVRGYIAGQGDLKETICKFQTTAAAQAREEVLDALARDFKGRYVEDAVAEIRRFPEYLRQSQHHTTGGAQR